MFGGFTCLVAVDTREVFWTVQRTAKHAKYQLAETRLIWTAEGTQTPRNYAQYISMWADKTGRRRMFDEFEYISVKAIHQLVDRQDPYYYEEVCELENTNPVTIQVNRVPILPIVDSRSMVCLSHVQHSKPFESAICTKLRERSLHGCSLYLSRIDGRGSEQSSIIALPAWTT